MEQKCTGVNGKEDALLEWEYRLPFFHASLFKKILLAFGIPILMTGIIFAFWIGVLNGLIVMLIVAGIFSLGFFLTALVFADGFHFTYRLTADGIWSHMGKREGGLADAATVGGILAGSPGTTGAGLLAKAEQHVFIPWNKIKKVKVVEKECSIRIGRSFGYKPIEMHGSPEHFRTALEIIRRMNPKATFQTVKRP